ncbi:GMC oxidoreductase [Craurococcus roseus]
MPEIRFATARYRPDAVITLRTSLDWNEDIPGLFDGGAWVFRLDPVPPGGIAFKFVHERQYWMVGNDIGLQPGGPDVVAFDEGRVAFPEPTELLVESGEVARRVFPPDLGGGRTYDVIVVGSGFGGGVLAEQLSDLGADVLVLEAGSYLFPTHVGNLPRQHGLGRRVDKNIWSLWDEFRVVNYVNAGGSAYGGGQGFNLGGRSLFWGGFIPPMMWWELDAWPEPVRWYLEGEGYALANDLLKFKDLDSDYQWQAKSWLTRELPGYTVLNAPMAIQDTDASRRTVAAGVFSTADLLMEARLTEGGLGKEHLTVNLNHAVVRIDTAGRRATGVVARDLVAGEERTFRAKAVVLSAGTVESAKLAQLSGLADPNGKAGAGMTDHPIFFAHFAVPASSPLYNPGAAAKILLRHKAAGLRSAPPHQDDHRYNVILELGADFNQGRFVDPDFLAEHLRVRGDTMLCEMVVLFNAPLVERNALRHAGPSFAKPAVDMQECPITAGEWQEIDGLKNLLFGKLQAQPLENGDLNLRRAGLGGVAHEVGTLRMGTDKARNYGDGVVDADLKFAAYDNLYACDLSVFPTSPAANPSLTLAALALRLAGTLKARI